MKKKALLLMLFFMFISTNALAQNVIWGYVTGDKISGVNVKVHEFSCGAIQKYAETKTNFLGQYGFEVGDIEGGRNMVVPSSAGYNFSPMFTWVGVPPADKYSGDDYCRDNGPCSEGEGDCDGDSECESGLICAQDVGADYGWGPLTDVCEN
jgi:hypothetical protein